MKEGELHFLKYTYIFIWTSSQIIVEIFVKIVKKKKNTEYLIACLNSENHTWYDTIFILEFFAEQEFFQFVEKYNFAPENEQKFIFYH